MNERYYEKNNWEEIEEMSTRQTIREKARDIPVSEEVDVLVVGGGPAGIMTAIASARNGAKTLLVEHRGFLGGNQTVS